MSDAIKKMWTGMYWPKDSACTVDIPEYSDWQCELFGTGPMGITFQPLKGQEPNFFWRWMQYICFGNKWIKVK